MSIKFLNKVWDGYPGNSTGELLVLLALADWSDDEGRSYPSIAKLGRKCRIKSRQAQRHIHKLITFGIVSVTGNPNGGKPGTTRRYRINSNKLTGVVKDRGVIKDADGCHGRRETGVVDDTQYISNTSNIHQLNSQANLSHPEHQIQKPQKSTGDDFNRFWQAYPNKVDKKKAESIWKRLKPDIEVVLKAIEVQKIGRQWREGYIPNPSKWLDGHRWKDESLETHVGTGKPWFVDGAAAITAEAERRGISKLPDELPFEFFDRVKKLAGITPQMVRDAEQKMK